MAPTNYKAYVDMIMNGDLQEIWKETVILLQILSLDLHSSIEEK